MKCIKNIITVILFIVTAVTGSAQEYSLGLVFDEAKAEKIPKKADLITRDYDLLPSSASLLKYCPYPGDQELYGTCTSWATTYHARTIAEAINNG